PHHLTAHRYRRADTRIIDLKQDIAVNKPKTLQLVNFSIKYFCRKKKSITFAPQKENKWCLSSVGRATD
ncbi:MAG: hypothetical protein II384_08790, partial [Prevotella sp.]|nr:hypothetical protein [Prevotella sp.]